MALDSTQKRGSATSLTMPHRVWLAVPDGTLASTDRMSLAKMCSAIAPGAAVAGITGPYFVTAAEVFTAGAVASEVFVAGASSDEVN